MSKSILFLPPTCTRYYNGQQARDAAGGILDNLEGVAEKQMGDPGGLFGENQGQ